MREHLPDLPHTRSISDPTSYEPFASFSCGGTEDYEQDVDNALFELTKQAEGVEFRVAETRATNDLIGVSAFLKKPLPTQPELDEYADAVYIALVAVRDRYRGRCMPDGARIGAFLLCDAFDHIAHKWGNPTPTIWSVVHRDNKPSKRYLPIHGFWPIRSRVDYPVHLRPAGYDWTRGFSSDMVKAVKAASAD